MRLVCWSRPHRSMGIKSGDMVSPSRSAHSVNPLQGGK